MLEILLTLSGAPFLGKPDLSGIEMKAFLEVCSTSGSADPKKLGNYFATPP